MRHLTRFGFLSVCFVITACSACACTIFVLTDKNRVLFCNNEDWKGPKTMIWFVPGAEGRFGCVYVGFDNGLGQGGMNTKGLAYDWVAGDKRTWDRKPNMKSTRGISCHRMLETCATVDQAAAFYREHWEPGFNSSEIMVADRSGASIIIGVTNGELRVDRSAACRGFGYGDGIGSLKPMLAKSNVPTLTNAAAILQAAKQGGTFATRYSNVFDLKSTGIFLYRFPEQATPIQLDLAGELKKGAHFYNIPNLREELTQRLRPLTGEMTNN